MAEVIDFQYFKDTGELISPKELEKQLIAALPDLDTIAALMEMTTDELIVELHMRIEKGQSLRDIPTDVLVTVLITRMSLIDIICVKASQMENNPK